ncbi:MAG: translation initiation factor IF-2 [Patescibacteria group bacterium]
MSLVTRPPVITIMGHVDHGKTTLLDYIRKSRVAAREAGGITQHVGAYQIEFQGKPLTFIDTPGHAAFNKMRQRGAELTDIVILVVAADDSVKPQTIESIRHIKSANVQVVVAINKMDLPNVYPDVVKAELAQHDLLVQGFGGDIDTVEISAQTGNGVDTLLETLALLADLHNYQADPDAPLEAVVVESAKDQRRGPVATVIVKQGTLQTRQNIMTDSVMGRVRLLSDDTGEALGFVGPGSPAEVIGFKDVPDVGEIVYDSDAEYSEPEVNEAETVLVSDAVAEAGEDPFADLDLSQLLDEPKPKLKLIIRADVRGSLEAIVQTLDTDSVELIEAGVGQVTDSDLDLADASEALIIAFQIKVPKQIKQQAKDRGVRIKSYQIIYELIEDLQKQMLKFMDSTIDEVITGQAEILQIFEMKGEKIAGVRVKTGEIKRSDRLHLKRADEIVANPVIKGMMHGKEEISSVKAKNEAGLTFKNRKLDFQEGDMIVAYTIADE